MGTSNFSDDFKQDAVAQITERGYHVAVIGRTGNLTHGSSPKHSRSILWVSILSSGFKVSIHTTLNMPFDQFAGRTRHLTEFEPHK